MDEFKVAAKDTTILEESPLVKEMKADLSGDEFGVYIGASQYPFHEVDGGLHDNGNHIVNLIHFPGEGGYLPSVVDSREIDVTTDTKSFRLHIDDIWQFGDYSEGEYTLSLGVDWYDVGSPPLTDE
jgi:hypothetical protein